MYKPNAEELRLLTSGWWIHNSKFKKIMQEKKLDLTEIDLTCVDLTKGAELIGANFTDANLIFTNFRGSNLRGANLRGAVLIGANFRKSNITGADFTDAIIDKDNFNKYIDKSIWECEVVAKNLVKIKRKTMQYKKEITCPHCNNVDDLAIVFGDVSKNLWHCKCLVCEKIFEIIYRETFTYKCYPMPVRNSNII